MKTYKESRSVPINLCLLQTFCNKLGAYFPVAKKNLHAWFEKQNAAVLLDIKDIKGLYETMHTYHGGSVV